MDILSVANKGGDPNLPLQAKINRVDKLYEEREKGNKANTILQMLDPLLEQRLGVLLDGFRQAPAELGPLLDFRAQLCEVWRMRQELRRAAIAGKSAELTLEGLLETALKSR